MAGPIEIKAKAAKMIKVGACAIMTLNALPLATPNTLKLSAGAAQHNLSDSGRNHFNGVDTWKQCNDPLSAKELPEL